MISNLSTKKSSFFTFPFFFFFFFFFFLFPFSHSSCCCLFNHSGRLDSRCKLFLRFFSFFSVLFFPFIYVRALLLFLGGGLVVCLALFLGGGGQGLFVGWNVSACFVVFWVGGEGLGCVWFLGYVICWFGYL